MPVKIRRFRPSDAESIVKILKENGQYSYPDVEGPEAMSRVTKCDAAVFLVAEIDSKVIGCIRAVYDGSRAIIHLLSINPEHQHGGIGTKLVASVTKILSERGAPTISVTVNNASKGFWGKVGFTELPMFIMLKRIS